MDTEVLLETNFQDLKLLKRGKVRDVYDLGDRLLIVSTDRISCFDVVLPTPIPHKGIVLNQISKFWFDFTKDVIGNHLITAEVNEFPQSLEKYKDVLIKRSMLVKKTKPLEVECIVRGYLSGSGWKEYQQRQSICGIKLTKGLRESQKLPQAIFTPSTKAERGHDVNISEEECAHIVGKKIFDEIKTKSIFLYIKASRYALSRGIIIADTKFEFGLIDDKIILIDEALTPDSSRFWPQDTYAPGRSQVSFDKQFVRDYLESIGWDKFPPAPELPKGIINKTTEKYLEAYERLTGCTL